jgi:hypothetical protein
MNHAYLVRRAAHWLDTTERSHVILAEVGAGRANEIPDAIGWRAPHRTTLVEVKVSRSDFLADRKKLARRLPGAAVGLFRYYMAPPGLIKPTELKNGWGLLEVHPSMVRRVRPAGRQTRVDREGETALLMSALKRMVHPEFPVKIGALDGNHGRRRR